MAGNSTTYSTPSKGVKTFDCPNCGGTVDVRAPGQTLVASCQFCKATVDITDERYRLLSTYKQKFKREPTVPLGTRGELDGIVWEVIGFMVRKSVKYRVTWDEHLLFNPIHGFRWLVQDSGHWNMYQSSLDKPDFGNSRFNKNAKIEGVEYKHFAHSQAEVVYVIGEFYWRIKVGERVNVQDMIAPPFLLSIEADGNSLAWTKGTYFEGKDIKKAFGKDLKLPRKTGIAPNQPNPSADSFDRIKYIWGFLVLALVALSMYFQTIAADQVILSKTYIVDQEAKVFPQETLTVKGKKSNLFIKASAYVDNNWVELIGNLNRTNTAENYGFQYGIEYYHGVDGGERWTEGSRSQEGFINLAPPGEYTFVLETAAPKRPLNADGKFARPLEVKVEIKSDVSLLANFFLILILISIYPILLLAKKTAFESQRWENAE